MQVDVDRFIDWLRLRGTPEAHLDAFRHEDALLAGVTLHRSTRD